MNENPINLFYETLAKLLNVKPSQYIEFVALANNDYRARVYYSTDEDPEGYSPASDKLIGQTLRYTVGENGKLQRISSPERVAVARFSRRIGVGDWTLTVATGREDRSYEIFQFLHDFSMVRGEFQPLAMRAGMVKLGGRTVVSVEHAVEILHAAHMQYAEHANSPYATDEGSRRVINLYTGAG